MAAGAASHGLPVAPRAQIAYYFSRYGMNDVMPPQFLHIGGPRLREVGMDRSMRRKRVIGVVQRCPDLALERV